MSIDTQVYVAPALLTGTISLALAIYVLRRRSPVFDARGLVTYLAASGVVSFIYVFLILAQEKWLMVFLLNLAFTMILVGALGVLHFSLAFASRLDTLTQRRALSLLVVTVTLIGTVWTDRFHHTFRTDVELYTEPVRTVNVVYGPTGQLTVVYLFALTLVSAYFILTHLFRSETYYQIRGLMVASAVVLPLVGSALSLANWPNPAINLTPIFTVLSGVLYTVAVTRYGLLYVVPLAYEQVVDNMEDSLIVTNPTGTVLALNPHAKQLIDVENPVGRPVDDLLPAAQRELDGNDDGGGDDHGEAHVDAEIADDGDTNIAGETDGVWHGQISIDRDDSERILDVRSVPIHASDGRVIGRAITLRDITELKSRERTLKRQNQRLDEFASMVTHDLRNPLNVAQLRMDLLSQEYDDENLDVVEDALARMEEMIDQMLTLSRSGKDIETKERCFLDHLVEKSWDNVQTDRSELDARLDGASVTGDPTRLLHVFENLFRNAVDHNNEPVTVRVGTLDTCEGFYVQDSGTGIPKADRDDIFGHSYTTSEDGSGLGLGIVADIVEAHGWQISVTESEEGGGARFEVRTD